MKIVNNQTVGFVYDGAQAIAEITGSAITATYLTGLQIDEVLARYAGSGNKTLLTDVLGSVIAQANDDQTIQNFYAYTPYGETQPLAPDDNNPNQYTARENDQTGLYYYRARYYDPVLKRFIQEDPIGLNGGLNVYLYVGGNPVNSIDPFGLVSRGLIEKLGESLGDFLREQMIIKTSPAKQVGEQCAKEICARGGGGAQDRLFDENVTQICLRAVKMIQGDVAIDVLIECKNICKDQLKKCQPAKSSSIAPQQCRFP